MASKTVLLLCLVAAVSADFVLDCRKVGSQTNCQVFDPNAYCGDSSQDFARFNDGTGCSCAWNYKHVVLPTGKAACVPANMIAKNDLDCRHVGSQTNCRVFDPHAFCGDSAQDFARFNDGTGCSCEWNYKYAKDATTGKASCVPITAASNSPLDCRQVGSQTHCEVLDPHAFCGESEQEFARFADGTGCSCAWNFKHVVDGAGKSSCVPITVNKLASPLDCRQVGSQTHCEVLDPHAFCGESEQEFARFADGTGCSCAWNFKHVVDGAGKSSCVPITAASNSPIDCRQVGSQTHCEVLDSHAFCGESEQEFARFNDGTGCSCAWNFRFVKDNTGKVSCVPVTFLSKH